MYTWQLLRQQPDLWKRYLVKQEMIRAIRNFFEARNYKELESPIITYALPQERYLEVLTTQVNLAGQKPLTAYLTPTTERFNKIALAAGIGEHFVITKVARGTEQISPNHSPEFTMLEWYHLNADYTDLMTDCEELIMHIFQWVSVKLGLSNLDTQERSLTWQGQTVNFNNNFLRINLVETLEQVLNVKLADIQSSKAFARALRAVDVNNAADNDDWQILFELAVAQLIEPHLPVDQPYFLYDYPKQVCPLTQSKKDNPLVCEKVELYMIGKELANGYTELLDWEEQKKRFKLEQQARKELGKAEVKFDDELVAALKAGLPPVAGIGMGLDRLAMLLADAAKISEINLFPAQDWLTND